MSIQLKRVYSEPSTHDGCRVLVDRLWPRGISKEQAQIDYWCKELAPSTDLRRWFAHDPSRWKVFKQRYFAELKNQQVAVDTLCNLARASCVTLIFAAKDTEHNQAVALKEFIEQRMMDASNSRLR